MGADMRTMFTSYLVLIVVGLVACFTIGLLHR